MHACMYAHGRCRSDEHTPYGFQTGKTDCYLQEQATHCDRYPVVDGCGFNINSFLSSCHCFEGHSAPVPAQASVHSPQLVPEDVRNDGHVTPSQRTLSRQLWNVKDRAGSISVLATPSLQTLFLHIECVSAGMPKSFQATTV